MSSPDKVNEHLKVNKCFQSSIGYTPRGSRLETDHGLFREILCSKNRQSLPNLCKGLTHGQCVGSESLKSPVEWTVQSRPDTDPRTSLNYVGLLQKIRLSRESNSDSVSKLNPLSRYFTDLTMERT